MGVRDNTSVGSREPGESPAWRSGRAPERARRLRFGRVSLPPNAKTMPRERRNPWRPRDAPRSGRIHSPARLGEPTAVPGCAARVEGKRGETGRSGTADRWRVEEKLSGRQETCHGQSTAGATRRDPWPSPLPSVHQGCADGLAGHLLAFARGHAPPGIQVAVPPGVVWPVARPPDRADQHEEGEADRIVYGGLNPEGVARLDEEGVYRPDAEKGGQQPRSQAAEVRRGHDRRDEAID